MVLCNIFSSSSFAKRRIAFVFFNIQFNINLDLKVYVKPICDYILHLQQIFINVFKFLFRWIFHIWLFLINKNLWWYYTYIIHMITKVGIQLWLLWFFFVMYIQILVASLLNLCIYSLKDINSCMCLYTTCILK